MTNGGGIKAAKAQQCSGVSSDYTVVNQLVQFMTHASYIIPGVNIGPSVQQNLQG
jgi:hypothetical protein